MAGFTLPSGVWERKATTEVWCVVFLFLSVPACPERRERTECQHFNLRLVMMKLGHNTQSFCFPSLLEDFSYWLALFIFVVLIPPVIISCGSLFSLGLVWICIRKFLISDPVLQRFSWLSLSLWFWSALIFGPMSLVSMRFIEFIQNFIALVQEFTWVISYEIQKL